MGRKARWDSGRANQNQSANIQRLNQGSLGESSPGLDAANSAVRFCSIALQALSAGMIVVDASDPAQPIWFASQSFLALTGFSEEEVLGRNCRFLQGPGSDPQVVAKIREAIQRGEPFAGTILNYRKSGEPFWNHLQILPVRDGNGTLTHFVGVQSDVTARIQNEEHAELQNRANVASDIAVLQSLPEDVRKSERLATLGKLASYIAHEIANPLSAAWTAAETALSIQQSDGPKHVLKECNDIVIRSIRRCSTIVTNVLWLSRQQPSAKSLQDVNAVVRRACDYMEGQAKQDKIAMELKLVDQPIEVLINAAEIEQVIVNLLSNAFEASCPDSTVEIRTFEEPGLACIEVSDHGRGMTPQQQRQIFDSFYTARPNGSGHGLGLAIVHEIVHNHGGQIDVVSKVGKGSSFTVRLKRK